MSDLISRSDVLKVLEECHLDRQLFEKDVFDRIKAIPTAYDVEKVVAELEAKELDNSSAQAEAQSGMCGNLANYYCGNKVAYNNAIDIVRKGGAV